MKKYIIVGALLVFASVAVHAQTRIELDETTVEGATELPKVLYIVPWQKTEMDTKPVKLNTMVDEVMSPVDRDVLQRQVEFYEENKLGQ
jgi:hypothetical protein